MTLAPPRVRHVRVSVLIPAYNAEHCIGRAIGSVLAQTEQDFEILVIDDASSDTTAALVEAAAARDPRIRLLRARENGGPGLARNQGIAAASGEWVAPLDADDRFHPQRLERLADIGERQGAEMVADNLLVCAAAEPATGAPMFPPGFMPASLRLDALAFLQGNLAPKASGRVGYAFLKPLIRRTFLRDGGIAYDPARFAEDYLLYLRCLLHGARWALTPEAMYDYTVRAASLTASHSAGDLVYLAATERALLRHPAVARDPALKRCLAQRARSVERALSWFEFATAVKQRSLGGALSSFGRDPRNLLHVGREGLRALPRAWAKRTAAGRAAPSGAAELHELALHPAGPAHKRPAPQSDG